MGAATRVARLGLALLTVVGLSGCLSANETAALNQLNDLRASRGVPALAQDDELSAKAQAHSHDMAVARQLFHTQLQQGVTGSWHLLGENLAEAGSLDQAFAALTNSPLHYQNMVDARFNRVGIGVFTGPDGTVWLTQEFAAR